MLLTEELQGQANQFRRGAKKIRKRMWWNNMRLNIIIATVVVVIIIIIVCEALSLSSSPQAFALDKVNWKVMILLCCFALFLKVAVYFSVKPATSIPTTAPIAP